MGDEIIEVPQERECGCLCEGCCPGAGGYGVEHCGIAETGCVAEVV